jgi:hypothetical protein
MKKYTGLFCALILIITSHAQQTRWVLDKEDLFTQAEEMRIDSLLQAYHKKSGNLVALYTDSINISEKDFGDKVHALFKTVADDSTYSYILMMCRKHSLIFSTVNQKTTAFVDQQKLVAILENGFSSFKEKKREEGVLKIFMKAIEFLDSLPKQ